MATGFTTARSSPSLKAWTARLAGSSGSLFSRYSARASGSEAGGGVAQPARRRAAPRQASGSDRRRTAPPRPMPDDPAADAGAGRGMRSCGAMAGHPLRLPVVRRSGARSSRTRRKASRSANSGASAFRRCYGDAVGRACACVPPPGRAKRYVLGRPPRPLGKVPRPLRFGRAKVRGLVCANPGQVCRTA